LHGGTTGWYWNTTSNTKPPLLGHCLWQKGYLTGGKRQAVIRCHNQSELPQCSIRHTQINPGLCLGLRGGSKSPTRAGITVRPKLARSCWSNTMMGNSLRETGRDRQGEQQKEVCIWLVLSRGFPQQEHPAGCQTLTVTP
jgi:hypothetical protein